MRAGGHYTVGVAAIIVALVGASVFAGVITSDWYTLDAGGATAGSSGGRFALRGTIGQPDAGPVLTGGQFALTGGFWSGAGRGLPGDCDGNGGVGLGDLVMFDDCLKGPEQGPDAGCACFDLDHDGHITLADFAMLQINFSGG